jgi:hypothetical protein
MFTLRTIADDNQPYTVAVSHRFDHLVDTLPGHQPPDSDELHRR